MSQLKHLSAMYVPRTYMTMVSMLSGVQSAIVVVRIVSVKKWRSKKTEKKTDNDEKVV